MRVSGYNIRFEDLPVKNKRASVRYTIKHKQSGLFFAKRTAKYADYELWNIPFPRPLGTCRMWLKWMAEPNDWEIVKLVGAALPDGVA